MIDLAITAMFARRRVEDQFATRTATPAAVSQSPVRAPVRRAAVHGLRAVADRLEPARRCVPQA